MPPPRSRNPMMAHTPWKIWNGWGPLEADGLMRAERIGPEDGGGIMASPNDMRGTKEDFERIVRAANSHEALVAALEQIAGEEGDGIPADCAEEWAADYRKIARAALALARQP